MRVLVVADLHANPPALSAIREPFDLAICLGDIVEYGVEPTPCVDWVKQNCRHVVRGNHDHGAAHGVAAIPTNTHGFKYLTAATRPLGRERLSTADRRFLAELPLTRFMRIDGLKFMLVHATPRDPLDEFAHNDPDMWARRLEGINADIVCVGHTHRPYALEVNGTLVVNPGSVGLQRDGDPRASYGIIEGRSVELKRIEYDVASSVQLIESAPLADDVKQLLTHVYRNGKLPGPDNHNGYQGQHESNKTMKMPAPT